ncbi:hypothetical protein BGX26_007855, partial [Mortierella sp. AD094]
MYLNQTQLRRLNQPAAVKPGPQSDEPLLNILFDVVSTDLSQHSILTDDPDFSHYQTSSFAIPKAPFDQEQNDDAGSSSSGSGSLVIASQG